MKGYERGLDVVLEFRFITLLVFLATLALSVFLFVIIPKGFFPQQDTGLITGISEAGQDVSVAEMMRHQEALGAIVRRIRPSLTSRWPSAAPAMPLNTGRMFITLKPRDQRTATADQVIARLRPQLAKVEGAALFLQAAQDVRVGGRASRTQYQYTMQGSDMDELNQWAPKMLAKMKTLPELRDVATDQQTNGTTLTLVTNRDQASRYGLTAQTIDDTLYDAFGQREIAQYFTQLSTYEVIMEVLPGLQGDVTTLDKIFLKSPTTGGEVPLVRLREMVDDADPAAVGQPSGAVSRGHHQFQSGSGGRRSARRPTRCSARNAKCGCRLPLPTVSRAMPRRFRHRCRRCRC